MKRIAFILLAIALVVPAFAQVENVKVGGDVTVTGVYRSFFGEDFDFFLAQTRVGVSAQLANKVSAMVRVINEREFGNDAPWINDLGVLLDLAYLKIDDLLIPGLSMTAGRQEIQYGDGLLVGSRFAANYYPTANPIANGADLGLMKAFDGLKFDYAFKGSPFTVSLTDAKISDPVFPAGQGENLWVLDAAYKTKMFSLEPYFVWERNDPAFDAQAISLLAKASLAGFDLSGEAAFGFGDANGWAFNVGGMYAFKGAMKPAVSLGLAWFSDDWAPFWPSNISDRIGKIIYAEFGSIESDLSAIRAGVSVMPMEKLDVALNVFGLNDAGFDEDYTIEADLGVTYNVTKDASIGVDLGYVWPGAGDNSWQGVVSMKVGF